MELEAWGENLDDAIDLRTTPKSFKKKSPTIVTNFNNDQNPKLSRANFFIDASVEVHLVTVLWLTKVGHILSKDIVGENYAYKLELYKEDGDEYESFKPVVNGLRLYKPYFIQYQKWRDEAIHKAQMLLDDGKNVVLLSLDIKDYFHSVKVDLEQIRGYVLNQILFEEEDSQVDRLFDLLIAIHNNYTDKLKKVKIIPKLSYDESILPIGLLSSGILGNYYLRDFDEEIKDKLNPAYYGRYVDDLLFVFSNVKIEHDAIYPINDFLIKYFVNREILEYHNLPELDPTLVEYSSTEKPYYKNPDISEMDEIEFSQIVLRAGELKFHLLSKPDLIIQSKKVILQFFDHKESSAIINKFKNNLEKNRSEYRFLPDEDEVDSEFDEEAFSLHYNDSINKLRSIKEFSEDKYGASKYLANKIFASSFSDEKPDKKTNKQILTFFKGDVGLAFHTLWEKVATYFIINDQPKELFKFYKQISTSIDAIDVASYEDSKRSKKISQLIKKDLHCYLQIAIATPLALNPNFFNSKWQKDFEVIYDKIFDIALNVRSSNMYRHFLLPISALNFTKYASDTHNNLVKVNLVNVLPGNYALDDRLKLLAPRYVGFHEINILEIYHTVSQIDSYKSAQNINQILNNAFSKYWQINNHWKYLKSIEEYESKINQSRNSYFLATDGTVVHETGIKNREDNLKNRTYYVTTHDSYDDSELNKKIAIANIKVDSANVRKSILNSPNTSRERRQELFNLINQVEKEKCNLFVLPETCVPYRWINLLVYQSHRRNIAIVAGLEHWINRNNFAFNFVATILPIQKKHYRTCLIKIRLKNHYSHEEKHVLKGYRLLIPSESPFRSLKRYDLFHWRKIYFSVYNCFELANIDDRGLFKSKVDFIIASEFNKDISYFSDIGGSWVRDIHSFFIQVNSSEFGDSRIIQPSQSVTRNILQIKGGKNSTILVDSIKIKELRDFQLKEYHLQKDDIANKLTDFKPTPPDFDTDNVWTRINNQ
nr:RNA-directed DNA polymerase [uncultured Mucilaginibacter sp.]